jgi:hypothetical protein
LTQARRMQYVPGEAPSTYDDNKGGCVLIINSMNSCCSTGITFIFLLFYHISMDYIDSRFVFKQ